jgi:hypothetical protein
VAAGFSCGGAEAPLLGVLVESELPDGVGGGAVVVLGAESGLDGLVSALSLGCAGVDPLSAAPGFSLSFGVVAAGGVPVCDCSESTTGFAIFLCGGVALVSTISTSGAPAAV